MPQCIAQQDQTAWLRTMTKCTHLRCTSHFGVICTHRQWLTQLSCLSAEFSPDAIRSYLPYCSRSILAKAQLYHWIHTATGRTWLVDVGDANELQNLSPASLTKGYANIDVATNAPTCLANSLSSPSAESFQHVLASCSFTNTTQHTGNEARPWEYSRSAQSMIALSFDTPGYDLTGRHIQSSSYFDKECFCNAFAIDQEREPCTGSSQIGLTRERLWLNATCGPASLPDNWTASLRIMGSAFIPVTGWHWPKCIQDMPRQVTDSTQRCETDACRLDGSGYCQVRRAVDTTCFCRNIDYESCQGSCQVAETRIDYVTWLYDLCGHVEDWHGLPDNWRELATVLPRDIIPWQWTVRPFISSNITALPQLVPAETEGKCPSNEWKLGSIALVNIASLLTIFFGRGRGNSGMPNYDPGQSHWPRWILGGVLIASLQLLPHWINGRLIKSTPGYETVPHVQLIFLWCSLPRLSWLTISSAKAPQIEGQDLSPMAPSLLAEAILQGLSFYYMSMTVAHGRQHYFFLRYLANAPRGQFAVLFYAGAIMWLAMIAVPLIEATRAVYKIKWFAEADLQGPEADASASQGLLSRPEPHSMSSPEEIRTTNSTLSNQTRFNGHSRGGFARLYMVTARSMPLIWLAQWVFWVGFIGLSSDEYVLFTAQYSLIKLTNHSFCLPGLQVLTLVWLASSVGSIAISWYL